MTETMKGNGKTITEAIRGLVELFAAHSSERSTLDELHQLVGERSNWHRAHELFQRIRRKNLNAERRGDAKLKAQYAFEEVCAKTLYNLPSNPAPFDPDSPYWIVPNALAAARLFEIDESDIIKAIVSP